MSNLTDITSLKTFLGISDDSEDNLLALLIPQVSDAIEEYLGRTFTSATYTEYYMGEGTPFLVLNQRPVTSITSVYLDEEGYWGQPSGSFAAPTLLQQGVDYALEIDQSDGTSRSGKLYRIKSYWPIAFTYITGVISSNMGPATGNVKVTYVGGSNAPANVKLACNMAIARIRLLAPYGMALQSESYEEYSYSLLGYVPDHIFTAEVRSLLARYRTIALG